MADRPRQGNRTQVLLCLVQKLGIEPRFPDELTERAANRIRPEGGYLVTAWVRPRDVIPLYYICNPYVC